MLRTHKLCIVIVLVALVIETTDSVELSAALKDKNLRDLTLGSATFFLSFIYNFMRSDVIRGKIHNYSAMYRKFILSDEHKVELELLSYFTDTYRKDLSNKCKEVVARSLSGDPDFKANPDDYYKLCQGWGAFVASNIHTTANLYDVEHAFKHYALYVRNKINWQKVYSTKAKKMQPDDKAKIAELEAKNELDEQRLRALVGNIGRLHMEDHEEKVEKPLNYRIMQMFYKDNYSVIFGSMFENGEHQRYVTQVKQKGMEVLDKLFAVDNGAVRDEEFRIRGEFIKSVAAPFRNAKVNDLHRYYMEGYNDVLVEPRGLYPSMQE